MSGQTIDGVDVSGWTAEQIAELRTLANESAIATQAISALAVESAKPANIIAEKRRAVEQQQRDAEDLQAFAAAKKKYGEDDIGTIETRMGLIIMRMATSSEDEELDSRTKELHASGRPDEAKFVDWQLTKRTIVYPNEERVEAIVAKFPRMRMQIDNVYVALINGLRSRALGK